jgi:hypothetical protein
MWPEADLEEGLSMLRRRIVPMLTAIAALGTTVSARGEGDMVRVLFASQVGTLPEHFTAARTGKGAAAEWKIVEDGGVPDGRVLAQTSTDRTDYRFPLAIYDGIAAANAEVTVRFKAIAGQIDRAGGIAVRLTDPDNYYVLRANALEDNVNFYRVVQGSRREIRGVNTKVTSDQWHTLGLRAEGDRFTVRFDGATLFTATDKTFSGAGKVALWTKADSVTQFADLTIQKLP